MNRVCELSKQAESSVQPNSNSNNDAVSPSCDSVKDLSNQGRLVETCQSDDTKDKVLEVNKEQTSTTDMLYIDSRLNDKSHLIQITASNAELMRRINALVEQKQIEVDINNKQEFCSIHPSMGDSEDTCARTCSVFIPRAGGKSHIKVSRVVNMYGPQTNAITGNQSSPGRPVKQEVCSLEGIEERLSNMEEHLNLTGAKKQDVYRRLKGLEERILFLESLSPEYFTSRPPPPKRQKMDARSAVPKVNPNKFQEMSLSEIDNRIQQLQKVLHKNSSAG